MTSPATTDPHGSWGTARRMGVAATVGIQLALLAIIVIGINWIANRRYRRWDWSDQHVYTLDDRSLALIEEIAGGKDTYLVLIKYQPDDRGAWEAGLAKTKDLLEEYKTRSHGKIDYDVLTVFTAGKEGETAIRKKYDIRTEALGPNDVLFKRGDRERTVNLSAFYEEDWSTATRDEAPRIKGFKGEDVISSTLRALVQDKPIVLGFTKGHGEADPNGGGADDWGQMAYHFLKMRESFVVETVDVSGPNGVPRTVDAVVAVGPTSDFSEAELRNLKLYLHGGGKVLILLESPFEYGQTTVLPGMAKFLEEWGIVAQAEIVFDLDQAQRVMMDAGGGTQILTQQPTLFAITTYDRRHPITRDFDGDNEVNLAGACSVGAMEPERRPEGINLTEICLSSNNSWGEKDAHLANTEEKGRKYTPNRDTQGPVPVAVAAEGKVKGQTEEMRLVVIGDATALTNKMFSLRLARPDLVLNSLFWLVRQEGRINIVAKSQEDRSVHLTAGQEWYVFRVAVLFLPVIALCFGATMWLTRRSQ